MMGETTPDADIIKFKTLTPNFSFYLTEDSLSASLTDPSQPVPWLISNEVMEPQQPLFPRSCQGLRQGSAPGGVTGLTNSPCRNLGFVLTPAKIIPSLASPARRAVFRFRMTTTCLPSSSSRVMCFRSPAMIWSMAAQECQQRAIPEINSETK